MKRLSLALGTLLFFAAACGGKVVVEKGGTASGGGGTGGACAVTPSDNDIVINVCVATGNGACAEDTLADAVHGIDGTCVSDPYCGCSYELVAAPCAPDSNCCYDVEVTETYLWCE